MAVVELTSEVVRAKAAEYDAEHALFAVEDEQVEGLPGAFSSGDFGWRDAAWVVRWYYRRYLGDYPEERRRAAEAAFGENDYEAVRSAIEGALDAPDDAGAVRRLTDLSGVDVPVAAAFLMFADPCAYVVVGEREWAVLREAGELDGRYPDPPSVDEYLTYLDACRAVADRTDCDLWSLYRALWRLYVEL